jgi:hypothetical protein
LKDFPKDAVWNPGADGSSFTVLDMAGNHVPVRQDTIEEPPEDDFEELNDEWVYGHTWKELARNAGWPMSVRRMTNPSVDDIKDHHQLVGWEIVIQPGKPLYMARRVAA